MGPQDRYRVCWDGGAGGELPLPSSLPSALPLPASSLLSPKEQGDPWGDGDRHWPGSLHPSSQGAPGTHSMHRHMPSHGRGTRTHTHSVSHPLGPNPPAPASCWQRQPHRRSGTRPQHHPPRLAGPDRHRTSKSRAASVPGAQPVGQGDPRTGRRLHPGRGSAEGLGGTEQLPNCAALLQDPLGTSPLRPESPGAAQPTLSPTLHRPGHRGRHEVLTAASSMNCSQAKGRPCPPPAQLAREGPAGVERASPMAGGDGSAEPSTPQGSPGSPPPHSPAFSFPPFSGGHPSHEPRVRIWGSASGTGQRGAGKQTSATQSPQPGGPAVSWGLSPPCALLAGAPARSSAALTREPQGI